MTAVTQIIALAKRSICIGPNEAKGVLLFQSMFTLLNMRLLRVAARK